MLIPLLVVRNFSTSRNINRSYTRLSSNVVHVQHFTSFSNSLIFPTPDRPKRVIMTVIQSAGVRLSASSNRHQTSITLHKSFFHFRGDSRAAVLKPDGRARGTSPLPMLKTRSETPGKNHKLSHPP